MCFIKAMFWNLIKIAGIIRFLIFPMPFKIFYIILRNGLFELHYKLYKSD